MVSQALKEKPQDVVVFMVGGVTYEESKLVAGVNETIPGVRIVLGGTSVINSLMFLKVLIPFPDESCNPLLSDDFLKSPLFVRLRLVCGGEISVMRFVRWLGLFLCGGGCWDAVDL